MRFDQYQSEEKAYQAALIDAIKGREEELMSRFIQEGPEALRQALGLKRNQDWTIVFDYLVFQKGVMRRCVLLFLPFFKNIVREKGPLVLRKILGIEHRMYDSVYEDLFDFVAIAHGTLHEYVYAHADLFVGMIQKGRGSLVKLALSLDNSKYEGIWAEILEFLATSLNKQLLTQDQAEKGLQFLDAMMQEARFQRAIRSM